MLVRARRHHHVVAIHALVAANRVRDDGGVSVPDMRQAVCVVNRRGQIELWFRLRHFLVVRCLLFVIAQRFIDYALQRHILFLG